jgi:1-deoxy-D-xylulose 5-phosphate reductoisomerase
MQKIRMIKDQHARHEERPQVLRAGEEYTVDDFLLRQLIALGVVELIEEKAVEAAPENKAIQQAPKRKGRPRAQPKTI